MNEADNKMLKQKMNMMIAWQVIQVAFSRYSQKVTLFLSGAKKLFKTANWIVTIDVRAY